MNDQRLAFIERMQDNRRARAEGYMKQALDSVQSSMRRIGDPDMATAESELDRALSYLREVRQVVGEYRQVAEVLKIARADGNEEQP